MKLRYLLHPIILIVFLGKACCYSESILDVEDRLSYTIVDLMVRLLSVAAPMDGDIIERFIVASQVFLESKLNIVPTTIINLQVAVGAQSLLGGQLNIQNGTVNFPLSIHVVVLVEYKLDANANSVLNDMEGRVRTLFIEEWEELVALLDLLDSTVHPGFFSSVVDIELESNFDPSDSSTGGTSKESIKKDPDQSSRYVAIIFIVVGVGVVLSLAMMTPLLFVKPRNR
jgi:hypothetical protein